MFGGDCCGLLTLHYGKHHMSVGDEVRRWFETEAHADVALACQGGTLRAHRWVLNFIKIGLAKSNLRPNVTAASSLPAGAVRQSRRSLENRF